MRRIGHSPAAGDPSPDAASSEETARARLGLVWIAGLLVAIGAGVATAHGLYQVALAAGVPRALAWLYPLITDGLALVAYATTTRLAEHGRRYAWTVVVLAAGLSGLTQASYLAGSVAAAPPALRFAIGAWPALAAAIVAHLLYLLGGNHHPDPGTERPGSVESERPDTTSNPPTAPLSLPVPIAGSEPSMVLGAAHVGLPPASGEDPGRRPPLPSRRSLDTPVGQRLDAGLDAPSPVGRAIKHPSAPSSKPTSRPDASPAGDRAAAVAREHAARHGRLPTVRELAMLARVARGTAATALKDLRQPPARQPTRKPASDARSQQ